MTKRESKQNPAKAKSSTPAPQIQLKPRPFSESEYITETQASDVMRDISSELQQNTTFDFSKCTVSPIDSSPSPPASILQPKLTIGEPNDKYEQEADRVAKQVVQQLRSPQTLQKVPAQKAPDQKSPDEQQTNNQRVSRSTIVRLPIQRKDTIPVGTASDQFEQNLTKARGGGNPIEPQIQTQLETAMGADFGNIKIHTDTKADQLSRSIQAKAFTTGSDVFFRQGAYQPNSSSGQELLAHELTHTIQQGAAQSKTANRTINRTVDALPANRAKVSVVNDSSIQRKYLEENQGSYKKSTYYKDTEHGTFYSRGALEPVDNAMKAYRSLTSAEKDNPDLATKNEHIDQKLKVLFQLDDAIEFWVFQHFDLKDSSQTKSTRITPTLDLQEEVAAAIKGQVSAYNQRKGTDISTTSLKDQLKSNSMDSALKGKIATLIDAVVQPGSLSKFSGKFGLAVDVAPPGYVGFDLELEVERKEDDVVNVRSELAATGGVRVPKVFDVKAKLGGYVEAEAANSNKTMQLISYGLYRKFIEADLMPARAAGAIWGGSFGDTGMIMAAKLASDTEREVFGSEGGDTAFVDLGLLAGISGKVGDDDVLGGELEYKYTSGQKYTKSSVEEAGGFGQVTKDDIGNKGKKNKGKDSSAHQFKAGISAGPFKGSLGYKEAGGEQEIQGAARFKGIPDFISFISNVEGAVSNFKSARKSKDKEKSQTASSAIQGIDAFAGALQILAKDGAAIQSMPTTSTEAEFAVKGTRQSGGSWETEVTFNQIATAPIPKDLGVVSMEAEKLDTRLKFKYANGSWKFVHKG